jgi:hypothetical protein
VKYQKPEVIVLGNASAAIQSQKQPNHPIDSLPAPSVGAYEVDE